MNETFTCAECGTVQQTPPAATVKTRVELNFRQIPAKVADSVSENIATRAYLCGECMSDATPVIEPTVSLKGDDRQTEHSFKQ